MTFAATRRVPWALSTPKMCLRPRLGRECIFGVFRAEGMCLMDVMWYGANVRGANSTPINHLAGFEGPFRGMGKGGGREGKMELMGENTLPDPK